MVHTLEEKLRNRRPLRYKRDAAAFLKLLIGSRCDECLVALFLDAAGGLIDHETVAIGKPDSVELDQRQILLRAIGRGAVGLIIAHNHPSGDPRPSRSDLEATRRLADAARSLGILLHDHFIVAGAEIRSALFVEGEGAISALSP
jgi:DNA repair protein RadC